MNPEKCYFRLLQHENRVEIFFLYEIENSLKQFNFNRNVSDSLKTLFARISMNIQKVKNKKSKKNNSIKTKDVDNLFIVEIYDESENPLSHETTCSNVFNFKTPLKLKISDKIFDIVLNAPIIINYNLSKSIIVGFPVFPENFKTLYTDRQLSKFNWFSGNPIDAKGTKLSDDHIEWQFLQNNFYYVPTTGDIGMKLKLECIPVNSTCIGPGVTVISKHIIEAGPGYCPFETRHLFTGSKLNHNSFRCVSYNILADLYCNTDYSRTVLYPYCPSYALEIDYRNRLILKELLGYNADIICLQEVDKQKFKHCLQSFFKLNGFEGMFLQKGKNVSEGLACLYRKKKFRLLKSHSILLAEALKTEECLQTIWNNLKNNKSLVIRLLDRTTVASATVLQPLDLPNEVVIVGNTHLYFHPDADHIRLIQGGIIIYWLNHLKNNLIKKYSNKRISLILCGDFNSVPTCGIYSLYTTGIAPETLPDWHSNVNEAVTGLSLTNDLLLESACGTPEFTNFTSGFADCLDYIFYEKNNLEVAQVIPFPSNEELTANTALPSIVFPSDHIALISDLQFKTV